jgi:hypothetical protein
MLQVIENKTMMIITLPTTLAELKSAMEVYLNDYGKHLPDVVKSKSSYENYRNIMVKVLECNRNESDRPLDAAAAKILADELYNAGGARNLGESAVTTATPSLHFTSLHFTSLHFTSLHFTSLCLKKFKHCVNSYLLFLPF